MSEDECFGNFEKGSFSFAYRDVDFIPVSKLCCKLTDVFQIDLTETNVKYVFFSDYLLKVCYCIFFCRDLSNLNLFTSLHTLILDKNNISGISSCPSILTLHTLWCNNNNIFNLPLFMDEVCMKFKSLKHLSLMRNPSCPGFVSIDILPFCQWSVHVGGCCVAMHWTAAMCCFSFYLCLYYVCIMSVSGVRVNGCGAPRHGCDSSVSVVCCVSLSLAATAGLHPCGRFGDGTHTPH